jgi:hypothetical protein
VRTVQSYTDDSSVRDHTGRSTVDRRVCWIYDHRRARAHKSAARRARSIEYSSRLALYGTPPMDASSPVQRSGRPAQNGSGAARHQVKKLLLHVERWR